jgi:argininosuccinate lyase
MEEIDAAVARLDLLLDALVTQAEAHPDFVLPGYTHLRRAQPVLWGHYLMAYFEMFARDRRRLQSARYTADALPLGSGALAGSGIPIDREQLARDLGFSRLTANSLDSTADRDFALEFLFSALTTFLHLSRLAEDWIIYSSEEFGFLELSDQVTSGSSLMPQKKNPDSLELLRGKTGRVLGALVGLATVVKGLPLTYNRDMQEDKEGLFDAAGQLRLGLEMAAAVVATATPLPAAMAAAAAGGWACATDLAEYLALHGVPFHEAHQIVGRMVRAGLEAQRPPEQWTLAQLREFSPVFGEDCLVWLRGTEGVHRREIFGGTGPGMVRQAIADARRRLAEWRKP